jgi:hypothetical protein
VCSRAVLCDCHCGPMYYFPVSLVLNSDFVMCWVSECGCCYNRSSGYFHLRTTRATPERTDEDTRRMTLCPNESCPTCRSMAITRSDDTSTGGEKTCWYCFDCGTEFPHHKVGGLWERLLRRFRPSSYHRLSGKHWPWHFPTHQPTSRQAFIETPIVKANSITALASKS